MALINCCECLKEISDKAGSCPNCGYPVEESVLSGSEAIIETPTRKTVSGKCEANEHDWQGCKCARCGKIRLIGHSYEPVAGTQSEKRCAICGRKRDWEIRKRNSTIALLFFLPPIGVLLTWFFMKDWSTKVKKVASIISGAWLIVAIILIAIASSGGGSRENQIKVPSSASSYRNQNFQIVIYELESAGFTNIRTEKLEDLITGWITPDGSVNRISINGNNSFRAGVWFPRDAQIIITYHTFPETTAAPATTTAPPVTTQAPELREGEIGIPASSSSYQGRNFENVISELQNAGFTNIKTEKLEDLITGWITSDGSINKISVGGITDFVAGSGFQPNAEIIITYHTFAPATTTTPRVTTTTPPTTTAPPVADDGSRAIYDNAVGRVAIDVYNELTHLGFTVSFKHTTTNMDMTGSVQWDSDYILWIITAVDSYNASSKTASFIINSQEMIDEAQGQSSTTQTLQAKLDVAHAWQAVESYGEREFPSGFDLQWWIGKLAETAEDENTWFLKATCRLRIDGRWVSGYTAEARVTGTTDSPRVTYFVVY
jgi:hypothetical protein